MMKLLFKILGKARTVRLLFNISPMYRSTGGRLVEVTDNLQYIKLKLPLTYRTKNYVGTLYGGKIYSSVDGIYMVQLINLLGKEYVVWDKSASIRFKRPGNQTLYAEFIINDALLEQIRNDIEQKDENDYKLTIDLKDKQGTIYAQVEKVIYIASKAYYTQKRITKNSTTMMKT